MCFNRFHENLIKMKVFVPYRGGVRSGKPRGSIPYIYFLYFFRYCFIYFYIIYIFYFNYFIIYIFYYIYYL